MDYVILCSDNFSNLEKQVISHFSKGYIVTGGVSVITTETGLIWAQAMILKED